ncbi:hypothetical protein SD81_040230 [Tolypothrix campylonemoides VB511288]|nr:hypothetical protein SD81_040230 [Tolypothrix campylonemoides VB511288]
MVKKKKDSEVRPRTSAHRYRYAYRRNPQLTYFTDAEWDALQKLAIKHQTNKSALIRNALNLYFIESNRLDFMLQQAKNEPYCQSGLFSPF